MKPNHPADRCQKGSAPKPPVSFRGDQLLPPMINRINKFQRMKQNPPTIVVPHLQQWTKIYRMNTPQTAVQVKTNDSIASSKQHTHPLTPHVHIVAELGPLLKRCNQFFDYDYIIMKCDMFSLFEEKPIDLAFQKKTETLNSILKVISDPVSRYAIAPTTMDDLFDSINKHIFRPFPDYQPPNVFSEVSTVLTVKNWDHVNIYHNILQILMNDQKLFSTLLNDEFIYNLLLQLSTPDKNEKTETENELKIILKTFPNKRKLILHVLLDKLISYIDGTTYLADSISSYLMLFLDYFTSTLTPLKQHAFLTFRTVFYRLISTDHSTLFEEKLHQISVFFQSRDPATAIWCLSYLRNHWPITSIQKQVMFLNQMTYLMPSLPATALGSVRPILLQIISTCIQSESYVIASKAIIICSNPDFLAVFAPQSLELIVTATRKATNHWKEIMREIAESLLTTLIPMVKSSPKKAARKSSDMNWTEVIQSAAKNDTNININNEVSKMKLIFENI